MKDLKNYILSNGGCTLTADLNIYNGNGFVVSRSGYEFTTSSIDDVLNKIREYQTTAKTLGAYIGVWFNTEDGLYYVDINNIYKDKKEAIFYGMKYKQLAIFDIENCEEIRMDSINYNDFISL